MEQSILKSTKKILGLDPDYEAFDLDVITAINSMFPILAELGVGPAEGFMIEDNSVEWGDYLSNNLLLNHVKTYIYFRVRMIFDPPTTPYHITAMNEQIREFEWRITNKLDSDSYTDPEVVNS